MLNGVNIVSVCDIDTFKANSFAKTYDIPRAYSSLAEMLATENLDVVHVLTQPQYHVPLAIECLRGGANVYVEKPLGLTTEECNRVVEEAIAQGRTVGVNHQVTRAPVIERIVEAARERKFGKINHVSVTFGVGQGKLPVAEKNHFMFSTPQALIYEYCPHPFSVIRRLAGAPLEVTALASSPVVLDNGRKFYRSWEIAAVTERGTAQLYFSAGIGQGMTTVSVYGEDAIAHADLYRGTLQFHENDPFPITAAWRDGRRNGRALKRQATKNILDTHLVKMKLKPASLANNFYPAFNAFYNELRAGRPATENAVAGRDVIAFCEMAAANMKTVDGERSGNGAK